MVTTNLVVAKTYILIRYSAGHVQAVRFLRSLRGSPRLQKVWSDASLEAKAEAILDGAPVQKVKIIARHESLDTSMIYFHEADRLTNPAEILV